MNLPLIDVTTPIVAFIFICLIFPKLVRSRPQFYAAFTLVAGILLLQAIAFMADPQGGFVRFLTVIMGLLRFVAFVLLVLCAGGLSLHELTGEVVNAFEVMRRGETEKTVIIPIAGQQPRPRDYDDEAPKRTILDDPSADSTPPPSGSVPLE